MPFIAMQAYELCTALAPCAVVCALLARRSRLRGAGLARHAAALFFFASYVGATFSLTSSGTLFDLVRYGQGAYVTQMNLDPFSKYIDKVAYAQNALLFVPLGFLLPFIWRRASSCAYILLSGLSFSLLIELSQLLNHRITDVDDLILNTLGALLGYLLYRITARFLPWQGQIDGIRLEPPLYIGAMFLGHFLLYNEMGLAHALFRF